MACCCFSVRCRPPDNESYEKDYMRILSENQNSFEKVSFEAGSKQLRDVLAMTERDKEVIKSQLSIWFSCNCATPICRVLRDVKSNVTQSFNAFKIVKRNKELTASRRQRKRYRKNLREKKYDAMTPPFLTLSSSTKHDDSEKIISVTGQCSNEEMSTYANTAMLASNDSLIELAHKKKENDFRIFKSADKDKLVTLSRATNNFEDNVNVLLIPHWFVTLIQSKPNINLKLLSESTGSEVSCYRRVELMAMSNSKTTRNGGFFHVSVQEKVTDHLDAEVFKRTSLNFDTDVGSERTKSENNMKKSNTVFQLTKHSSHCRTIGDSPTMRVRRKLKPYTKIPPTSNQDSLDSRDGTCHQRYVARPSDSLSSGDFVMNKIPSVEKTANAFVSNMHDISKVCQVAVTTALPSLRKAGAEYDTLDGSNSFYDTSLNISNSSSNGVNRTGSYTRDYFSETPKTKSSYVKQPIPKDSQVRDALMQHGEATKISSSNISSMSSPYRKRYSRETNARGINYESLKGKSVEEINYKRIKTGDEVENDFASKLYGRDHDSIKHTTYKKPLDKTMDNNHLPMGEQREPMTNTTGFEKHIEGVYSGMLQKHTGPGKIYKSSFEVNLGIYHSKHELPDTDFDQKNETSEKSSLRTDLGNQKKLIEKGYKYQGEDTYKNQDTSNRGNGVHKPFSENTEISRDFRKLTSKANVSFSTNIGMLRRDEDRAPRSGPSEKGSTKSGIYFNERKSNSRDKLIVTNDRDTLKEALNSTKQNEENTGYNPFSSESDPKSSAKLLNQGLSRRGEVVIENNKENSILDAEFKSSSKENLEKGLGTGFSNRYGAISKAASKETISKSDMNYESLVNQPLRKTPVDLQKQTEVKSDLTIIPNPPYIASSEGGLDQIKKSDISKPGDLMKKLSSMKTKQNLNDASVETKATKAEELYSFPNSERIEKGANHDIFSDLYSRGKVKDETYSDTRSQNSDSNSPNDFSLSQASVDSKFKEEENLKQTTSSTLATLNYSKRDHTSDLHSSDDAISDDKNSATITLSKKDLDSKPSLYLLNEVEENPNPQPFEPERDQGEGIAISTAARKTETKTNQSKHYSSAISHGDSIKNTDNFSQKRKEQNKLEKLNTFKVGSQNDAESNIGDTILNPSLSRDITSKPERSGDFIPSMIQMFTFPLGNKTSNAGGDEDEEVVAVSPKRSDAQIEKSEPVDTDRGINDKEEKEVTTGEVSAKQDEEKDTGEQKKEDPCSDALSECMQKWGRPRCGKNYSFVPNPNPPCCMPACGPCDFQTPAIEETNKEEGKDATKEESKVMKCNYTGFTDDKQCELDTLIQKHVSYLRCTQGQGAAMSKQCNFISTAPDLYSKICKDAAFKSSAGLFNQTINKEMYSYADICGKAPDTCRDPCPKLPPLCKPPPCCPDVCPPPCCRDPCPKLPKLCCTPPPCGDPCFPAPCCTKLPKIGKLPPCCPDPCPTLPRLNPDCCDPCSSLKCPRPFRQRSYCGPPCNPCPPRTCLKTCSGMDLSCLSRVGPYPYWSRRCRTPQPCCSRNTCIDPCADPCLPKPCSPPKPFCSPPLCADPCLECPKPCSPRPCCTDPCTGLPRSRISRSCCIDPCLDCPKPCSPRPCCTDPCTGLPRSRISRSCCIDPCLDCPKPCSPRPCCTDPCTGLPRSRISRSCCIDPCTGLTKPCSPPPCCTDPCTGCPKPCSPCLPCIDPCTGLPKRLSPRACCIDPCTGLPKRLSPRPCCIDPCTGLPKRLSPRPCCIDPCTGLPKRLSPRPCCIDPCTGLPKRSSSRICIDPCTGLAKPYSCRPCCTIDPCTGLPKLPSPRPWCIDPCTGLPKSCADPCSVAPISCRTCPSVPLQCIIDPVTQLPRLCNPYSCCLDPCDKISSISCNSASDTKLSLFSSALSRRSRLPTCCKPCNGSLSFLFGNSCPIIRRRSSSLDHCTRLDQRKVESLGLAKRFQCMESKWSAIRQRACQVFDQVSKLQQDPCCPRPCMSPCARPCPTPICNPCVSPLCNPCSSPICKPCPSPVCCPYVSPTCGINKCIPVCPEIRSCSPARICCPTSPMRSSAMCYSYDTACRSACNQTSGFACRPISRCSVSCAQLNESGNKKIQVGSTKTCAEISTNVGPSLMGPQPQRKKGKSEKRCTIVRLGKFDEGGQIMNPNATTDVSCCSTQAEEGKIAEIAKFVKECFDDSIVSTAPNRPVVKIRYNKGANKQCLDPSQDARLREQIAKAIKKGKEIQKQNSEKDGKNGPRSRTVLKFKAGKDSQGTCEIYNVQLEDETPDITQRVSSRKNKPGGRNERHAKKKSEMHHQISPSPVGYTSQENVDNKYLSSDDVDSGDSQENFNQSHQKENVFPTKCKLPAKVGQLDKMQLNNFAQEKKKDLTLNSNPDKGKKIDTEDLEEPLDNEEKKLNHVSENRLSPQQYFTSGEKCYSSDPQSKELTRVEQLSETDVKFQSISKDKGKCDNQSNTNENANSTQAQSREVGSLNSVSGQIWGILSGPDAYSYDLSKYEQADKALSERSESFMIDMFGELNEAPVGKFSSTTQRQDLFVDCGISSKSAVQKYKANYVSPLQVKNNVRNISLLKCREIERRCLHIDDPSWEAFEYIGAHVFSLPTSYSSAEEHLKKTYRESSSHCNEEKIAKKRQVFSKSSNIPGKHAAQKMSKIKEMSVSKRSSVCKDFTTNGFEGSKNRTLICEFNSSRLPMAKKSKAESPGQPFYSHLHNHCFSDRKYQQKRSETNVSTANKGFEVLRETKRCDSFQCNESNLMYTITEQNDDSLNGDALRRGRETTQEGDVDTGGSEGSFHGIEDLPFETESLFLKKQVSKEKLSSCLSEGSTVSSQCKILYAGDYVEVCSSAPLQNKILIPNDRRDKREKEIEKRKKESCNQGKFKKDNSALSPVKKIRKFNFKITPVNIDEFSEKNLDCKSCSKEGFSFNSEPSLTFNKTRHLACGCNHERTFGSEEKVVGDHYGDSKGQSCKCKPCCYLYRHISGTLQPLSSEEFSNQRRESTKLESQLKERNEDYCRQNTNLVKEKQHLQSEVFIDQNIVFQSVGDNVGNVNIFKPTGLCHQELPAQISESFHFDTLAEFDKVETARSHLQLFPRETYFEDAQTLTCQCALAANTRDTSVQAVPVTFDSPTSFSAKITISKESSRFLLDHEAEGGGDAWHTVQVGCAKVVQASENRVVLQGAYIKPKPENSPMASHCSFKVEDVNILPFRFVFLRTGGEDQNNIRLKGTYARPTLEAPSSNIEVYEFQL